MAFISENNTVCTISNMGQYSSYSIMGANITLLNDKYCIHERNVHATWRARVSLKIIKELSEYVCRQIKSYYILGKIRR